MNTSTQSGARRFPIARCDSCGKDVLAHLSIDEAGAELRLCVQCDTPISNPIEWLDADELEASGYYLGAPPAAPACSTGGSCSCSTKKH